MSYTIEQFYRFFQGVMVFQTIYLAILYGITRRKDMLVYSIYLLFQAIYFFWNAPFIFFNIDDEVVFGSFVYHHGNMPLITIANLAYIYFLQSFFSSLYKNKVVDRLVLFLTIASPALIALSSISIIFFNSNQYIFYVINLLSTFFSIYLLIDIRRRKIKNIQWIATGMIFNIIGNLATVVMIIMGQFGIHNLFTIGYPLLFMRFGILFDMVFYQIAILKKWRQQEKELAVQQLQTALEVEKVKSRIGAELHDDVGSTLSGISMYSHMAMYYAEKENKKAVGETLQTIRQSSDEMVSRLNDIVWFNKQGTGSIGPIIERLKGYAAMMCLPKGIDMKAEINNGINELTLTDEVIYHIYLIGKEAVNNAVKYSGTKTLTIIFSLKNNLLLLEIKDEGSGFATEDRKEGNGILNMKKRAGEMDGKLSIHSEENKGTSIRVEIPVINY